MEIPNEKKLEGVSFMKFLIRTYDCQEKIFYNLMLSFLAEKGNEINLKEFLS